MNKHGAEKMFSIYWFIILFLVAASIVYMVSAFYGKPYDVRETEAGLLTDKISGCLSSGGYINENWKILNDENILAMCGLNFNVEETYTWDNDQHYVKIAISSFNSEANLKNISAGNPNLKLNCAIENKNFPFCLGREMYSVDKENNQYKITLLSVVRKTEKNTQ